jgi:NADPH-dependent 2,4-dienoyl-CoA reductase/sulfur reductase-like enzyme
VTRRSGPLGRYSHRQKVPPADRNSSHDRPDAVSECGRAGLLDHEQAREASFDPVSETVTAGSRSGYYPGGDDTDVTLVADRESGRVLGGSIVGEDRAAIRIDMLATAIEADMTVDELERLDLAYAPPFSPVWDPVLVAAKVLNGKLD